jgi:vitamin B12 transporter
MLTHSSSRPSLALLLLLNAPALALAQQASTSTTPAETTDYVVTATRSPQAASAAVRPVQVITAQEIRSAGVTSLPELLRSLGVVEATSNGGMGQASGVHIRGANSDQTVVLVDGVRIGSATLGTAPLEALPLALIERVEVLPGASSSLYGSDAIGGVIQIFTKSAKRSPGVDVALTAGNQGLRQASASYAARQGDTELALGLSRLHTDGFSAALPNHPWGIYNPDRDGFDNLSSSLKLTQHLGEQQLGLQFLSSLGKSDFDSRPSADDESHTRSQTLAAHWAGPLAPGVRSELRAGRSWDDATSYAASTTHFNTVQDQASWINRLDLTPTQQLVAGLEWLRQRVDASDAFTQTERTVRAALLGWHARYGALSVQADARRDDNSQFGQHSTGQLALAWQASDGWRLRAATGTAFRAPTFNQLYYPLDSYGSVGNPNLKAEQAHNAELGSDWQLGGLSLGATLFKTHTTNLINWVTDPATWASTPVNVGSARNHGLSLSAAGALGAKTRAKLNLTLQNPEDAETGKLLQRRAQQFAGLHLTHQIGQISLGSDLSYVGRRFDSVNESASTRMGAYGLVALFGSWQLNPDWALEGRLNNVADKRYTSAIGYATPGRQGQLTLRWTPAL